MATEVFVRSFGLQAKYRVGFGLWSAPQADHIIAIMRNPEQLHASKQKPSDINWGRPTGGGKERGHMFLSR